MFREKFKDTLEEMIPKETDDYRELKYSDDFYVHVWSHPNGRNSFEISVVVPHEYMDGNWDFEEGLFAEISSESEELLFELKGLAEEVAGQEYPNFNLYLVDVVTDGTWKRDASVYETPELKC